MRNLIMAVVLVAASFRAAMKTEATHILAPQRTFAVAGGILSAVFVSPDHILVQAQSVSHPQGGDIRITIVHRSLATYAIKGGELLSSVSLGDVSNTAGALSEASECGRIVYIAASDSVVLCNPDGYLTVAKVTQPKSRRTIRVGTDGHVSDFVVSERQKLLYAVGVAQKGAVVLSTYSLESGDLLQSKILSTSFEYPVVSITLSDDEEVIAVAANDSLNRKLRGSVILCRNEVGSMKCDEVMQKSGVAEASFLTRNILLFVTPSFAGQGHRGDCIQQMDTSSHTIEPHEFCKEGAGVHYSLATVGRDTVVGFTGGASYNGFTERIKAADNSFTLWNVESKRVMETTENIDLAGFQGGVRVVADKITAKRFLGFQRLGNSVFLYSP